jgi:Zn-finger nucleic acid-binding protein
MEAQIARCGACGAPIPANAVQCPYCLGQAATVACPKCLGMVAITAKHCPQCGAAVDVQEHGPAGLKCPECRQPLVKATVGGVDLSQCHRCGGLWLTRELFEGVAADREERGAVLGALPGDQAKGPIALEAVHYRPCPQCARMMNRTNYGRISGVILDTCKDHGLWFDKDELRRVLEFIQKGGLDKSRELQIRELDEKKRLAEASKPLPSAQWEEPRLRQGPGLLDLIGAVGAFMERLNR